MKKEYPKDMEKQMCQIYLKYFDNFDLDETSLSEEDREYVLDQIEKEAIGIQNKIKYKEVFGFCTTIDITNYFIEEGELYYECT